MRVETTGILRVSRRWAWLECCRDTIQYYQWFLRKRGIWLNEPVWKSHVTLVRESDGVCDFEPILELEGTEIPFVYDTEEIYNNGIGGHWWLEVESKRGERVREMLELSPQPEFDFHLTIGKEWQRGKGCKLGTDLIRL